MAKNYLIYPCKTMRITQSYTGTTSHLPHTTGSPKDYPIDEGCSDTGRDYIYCPCDEMKVKRIYGVGTGGTNTIWLESTSKVYFADGTHDYFTMLITHPGDDDLKKITVGQKFKRKAKICLEGKDGATAYHLHIAGGSGKFKGNGWVKNSNGKYVITTTKKAKKPENIFYIDTSFTKIVNAKGLKFKDLPKETVTSTNKTSASSSQKTVVAKDTAKSCLKSLAGTYKATSKSNLNVRHGASTTKTKMVAIPSGTKVKCYGYYTSHLGTKWLYIQFSFNGVAYTGFASSKYLAKV